MQRREALKLFLAGGVLPVVPGDLFGFFRDSHPASGYALRTLDPHQNELVVAMIDQIIPATDTPGAKGARVNEFIDVILTEWANDEERRNFLSGLADVDKQSNTLFDKGDLQMQDDFFTVFKKMTVHGYYTSEIGFGQELKLQIIPGAQHGCVHAAPGAGDAEG